MVREPDATMQPTLQDNQLMSKHRVLSFKPQLRLEWRGQDGQSETEQPDHSASLGDSITLSTQIRFSVHTARFDRLTVLARWRLRFQRCRQESKPGLVTDPFLISAFPNACLCVMDRKPARRGD